MPLVRDNSTFICKAHHCCYANLCHPNSWVQGEEEGPGDILDEELQEQLNEMADYDSSDEAQPTVDGKLGVIPCSLTLTFSHLNQGYACNQICLPDCLHDSITRFCLHVRCST